MPQASGNKRDDAKLHANNGEKTFFVKGSKNNFIFATRTYPTAAREKSVLQNTEQTAQNGQDENLKYNYLYAAFKRNLTSTDKMSCQTLPAYLRFLLDCRINHFLLKKTANFVGKKHREKETYISCKINQIDPILLYSACKLFFFSEIFPFNEIGRH